MAQAPPLTPPSREQGGQDEGPATSRPRPFLLHSVTVSRHHERRSAQGSRALVVLSLVSSIYVRLRSSVFGSICLRRSRTLTAFGELLS
jgi:hypothetical protein